MGKIKNAHREDSLRFRGLSRYKEVFMLDLVFLTDEFYRDYANCPEIEKKPFRPHVCVAFLVDGHLCCVPFRSHISHEYAIFTDRDKRCGLDFSKTVVITDSERYINQEKRAFLRQNEYEVFKKLTPNDVKTAMTRYLKQYKRAKKAPQVPRNREFLKYSCIKYFEEYFF